MTHTIDEEPAAGRRHFDELRVELAARSLDADLAPDGPAFAAAVEAELRGWDMFNERLQATAAARTGEARVRAEAAVKDLRRRRLAVAQCLDDLRATRDEGRHEQRRRVTAARHHLERLADEVSKSLFSRKEPK